MAGSTGLRVTVVHDCALTRRALAGTLSSRQDLDATVTASVAASPAAAGNGLDTDVLVLDLKLAGRGRLDLIRREHPGLPIVLLTGSGSGEPGRALDAVLAGAGGVVGVVPLPSGRDGTAVRDAVRADLVPLLLALRSAREPLTWCTPLPGPEPTAFSVAAPVYRCLVIGSGRTGLPALADLLAALPPDLPVPVTVAAQLPEGFETVFAQRLLARSAVPVELAGGDLDETFREAANRYGAGTLAVVLNGPGSAGVHGATAVRAAGGTVLAEAEERGRVWGLPEAVAMAGQADRLVPLDDLPAALTVLLAVALTPNPSAATGRHAHEHLEVHA